MRVAIVRLHFYSIAGHTKFLCQSINKFTYTQPGNVYSHPSNVQVGGDSGITLRGQQPSRTRIQINALQYSTSSSGSSSFSVVVPGPPNTANFGPSLSLRYDSSQHFLGFAGGAGLSLAGLPVITRNGQTTAQDGVEIAVGLNDGDRLSFGGQRLVNVSGAYMANGTTYGSEVLSMLFITGYSDPAVPNGPANFLVKLPSGVSLCLGCTEDSRFHPAGRSDVVHAWGMSSQWDAWGNYLNATYTPIPGSGVNVLAYVNYTGNANAQVLPHSSIVVNYEPRPDVAPTFIAGYEAQSMPVRITNITSFAGEAQAYALLLDYTQACATGVSLIKSIQMVGSDSSWCYNPVQFEWDEACGGSLATLPLPPFPIYPQDPVSWQQLESARIKQTDWNGDGLLGESRAWRFSVVRCCGSPHSSVSVPLIELYSVPVTLFRAFANLRPQHSHADFFVVNSSGTNDSATIYVNAGNGAFTSVVGPPIWRPRE